MLSLEMTMIFDWHFNETPILYLAHFGCGQVFLIFLLGEKFDNVLEVTENCHLHNKDNRIIYIPSFICGQSFFMRSSERNESRYIVKTSYVNP